VLWTRDHLEDIDVEVRILLKQIAKRARTGLTLRLRTGYEMYPDIEYS
jgi:hypothetical protein